MNVFLLFMKTFLVFLSFVIIFTSCNLNSNAQGLIVEDLTIDTFTTSGFTVSWTNSIEVDSYLKYGHTRSLELGELPAGTSMNPSVSVTGASPSQLFYVQAVSQLGNNIHLGDTIAVMTQSLSSGQVRAYFNQPVDTSYAFTDNNAINVGTSLDDSLVAYINRAQQSIEATFYNSTHSSAVADIIGALNDAFARGVTVRVIYNENTSNSAIANLNPSIPRLESPPHDFDNDIGIMHHKFFVFDADEALSSYVWTGSTNMTTQQVNTDANHVVVIQDQSVAKTFRMEFDEMWGGSDHQPNEFLSRFGKSKIDDTPHLFFVDGKPMEVYFSPSDNVQDNLIRRIQQAEESLYVNTMLITQSAISDALIDKHNDGVSIGVLLNTEHQSFVFEQLKNELHGRLATYEGVTGVLHHKTLFGDVGSENQSFVFTGSHNWSRSADRINDENTVIIYDDKITNQFQQEFMARYLPIVSKVHAENDTVTLSTSQIELIPVIENDTIYFTAQPNVSIVIPPKHGQANGSVFGLVSYLKDSDYVGKDSLSYVLCNNGMYDFCDTAWLFIHNESTIGIEEESKKIVVSLYPNPASSYIILKTIDAIGKKAIIYSQLGEEVYDFQISNTIEKINLKKLGVKKGKYYVVIQGDTDISTLRFVVH